MLHCSRAAQLAVGAGLGSLLPKQISARDLVLAQLFRIHELRLHMVAQPNLFAAEVPRLQHLSLQYCSLQWDSSLWANLVSLELIHSPIHVDLLANMPHLRSLTLIESFSAMVDTKPVLLAHLEMLTLTGSSWLCAHFLQAISVPQSHIVLNTPYSAEHLHFVWDVLERHRVEVVKPVICGLTFADCRLISGKHAVFEVGLISNHLIGHSAPLCYVVRLSGAGLPLPWRDNTIATLLTILSLDHITSLTLQCECLWLTAALHLRPFCSVMVHRDIAVFTSQFEGDPLMATGDRFDVPVVHYPQLCKIVFHHVAFGDRHMESILDWLVQRKCLLLAIEEIRLVGCTLTTADYGSLKELVGCVYVEDG
ncbi:hypothetical protein DFH08DRAFT_812919 [Mycena albidolilacea]|uniref:Uncharacterized protein n=1 Tax=Mycena albidolilacea TaxID=1033008 RepID=A0AAD6ZT35_9AGAR|nr:hypothetical protein DFH08DRAFT_812919 [Mycena albidolilacea]